MNARRSVHSSNLQLLPALTASLADRSALQEEAFLAVIWHERKRAERSQKPCVLMLIEMESVFPGDRNREALTTILSAISAATRETDVTGWYKDDSVVGVLFTEIAAEDGSAIVTTVMSRVSDALRSRLGSRQFNQVSTSFHLFPEEHEQPFPAVAVNPTLYNDVAAQGEAGRLIER
jgi:hypothetical protein